MAKRIYDREDNLYDKKLMAKRLITNILLPAMRYLQKQWCSDVAEKYQPMPEFEDLVFVSRTYRPINAWNVKDSIHCLIRKIDAQNPGIHFKHFTPHCLRHTFATNCIEKGAALPKVISWILEVPGGQCIWQWPARQNR